MGSDITCERDPATHTGCVYNWEASLYDENRKVDYIDRLWAYTLSMLPSKTYFWSMFGSAWIPVVDNH